VQVEGGGVMEAVKTGYLEQLLRGLSPSSASRGWLQELRADALERANALAVPTTRDEDWRFTDLSPLYRTAFQRAETAGSACAADVFPWTLPEAGNRLVFLDGHFVAALSEIRSETGLTVQPLAAAVTDPDALLTEHLGRHVDYRCDPFAAVNTTWLQDGALIALARNHAASNPVHLLFLSTRADVVSYPRVLLLAQPGSDCTLIEDFACLHEGAYFTNAVAEIVVARNARVRHVRLQREGKAAFHICTCGVRVERDGYYQSVAVALGGRISRYNLNVTQAGEGAQCRIDGLALIEGRQLADTHSLLDHACPDGSSRQMHKCIVGGAAHAVFGGKILVRPGAQRTNSSQESRNLLLTDKAHVDTKPQLEIFADDVKCAHGAAIGQLDPEHVFYLKSRGLSESTARDLLTFAFATEIVERIPVPSLVKRLEETVVRQTSGRQG
jgi:Fe-S cluster assembly protein SufD